MSKFLMFLLVFATFMAADASAQRRGRATSTFAVVVTDPGGSPLGNVLVTLDGPVKKSARTEGGRIAFEELPAGDYLMRFERDGFVTLERELTAKGSAPIDVKVTLAAVPEPPAPVAPPAPPRVDAKPVVLDVPDFTAKNYVKRDPRKISPLACATDGNATLVQFNEPLAEHAHADSDEFVYVIAGEGTMRLGAAQHRVAAGAFVMVPRGLAHSVTPTRGPLVAVSIRAGEGCAPSK
jgi:hypothetical protein